jgi:hypothetical protein
MCSNVWIRISDGDNSVEKEGLLQMGALKELPKESEDVKADDQIIGNGEGF